MSNGSKIKAQAVLALLLGMGAFSHGGQAEQKPELVAEPDFSDMRIAPPLSHRQERGHPLNPGRRKK